MLLYGTGVASDPGPFVSLVPDGSSNAPIALAEALDTVGSLNWSTTNGILWFSQTDVTHDGVDAAQSPAMGHNTGAMFQTIVTGPGTISYWWKVSSEANNDRLAFTVNGAEQARISGEVDWQSRSFPVPAGSRLLRFAYQKNSSVSAGQDRAWVDQVQFTPSNAPCTYSVSPTSHAHGYAGASNAVTISTATNCSWSVINTNPWISIPVSSGSGSAVVPYLVASNSSSSPRNGYVSIANWLVYITQTGTPAGTNTNTTSCTITLSPNSRSHGFSLSTGTVSVSTSAGCAWNALRTNSWITILSGSNGSGNGTVIYRLTANSNATARTGSILVGGQVFTVTQAGNPPPLSPTPVAIPPIGVTNIGHLFYSTGLPGITNGPQPGYVVQDFLIDQDHGSGGGAKLPNVSVNWDTNSQFTMTVAAPPGNKFLVEVPEGRQVGFAGFLWWESTRGGSSPAGTAAVQFENLEGEAPEFSGTTPVLSDSHGFFGFVDLEGTTVSNSFAFTAVTLTGTVTPQFTGNGTEGYLPHAESSMLLYYTTSSTTDPGSFVSLVPTGPLPFIRMVGVSTESGVELVIYGHAGRTHVVECSIDTVTWIEISSGAMPPSGSQRVRDASKTSATSRFYRVVELP